MTICHVHGFSSLGYRTVFSYMLKQIDPAPPDEHPLGTIDPDMTANIRLGTGVLPITFLRHDRNISQGITVGKKKTARLITRGCELFQ
jgi:hypothetical protein